MLQRRQADAHAHRNACNAANQPRSMQHGACSLPAKPLTPKFEAWKQTNINKNTAGQVSDN